MSDYTPNYNLKKPLDGENYNIADQNGNMDIIDQAMAPTADPTSAPIGNGPGKLVQWVSWIANRLKAITGKANWWDAPAKSLEDLNSHMADYSLQVPYGGATTNNGNAYSIATPAIAALAAGMAISIKINTDSTGASTLNWDGKGAKPIKKANGTNVTNLKANGIYTLRYDGANFILQGEGASGNAIASNLLSGKTASTDAGDITGTMPDRAGDTAALSSMIMGTTLKLKASEGYRDGVNDYVTHADPNRIAANIKKDINLDGIDGAFNGYASVSPGENVVGYRWEVDKSTPDAGEYTLYTFTANVIGTLRLSTVVLSAYNSHYLGIYANGVLRGSESAQISQFTTFPFIWTVDVAVTAGEVITVRARKFGSYDSGSNIRVGSLTVKVAETTVISNIT